MRDEIRAYLLNHRAQQNSAMCGDGDSLLQAGIIDSMGMIDLIAHLETAYGIIVDEDEMTPENFDSVDAVVAYVAAKQSSKPKSTTR
ncbi:MAG TPA: phosphopantetheine-binding protein [Planctomycetaceae bacterium]|nr:phosphopantetheine-binding protein [Planctomycetaceae bacterium]